MSLVRRNASLRSLDREDIDYYYKYSRDWLYPYGPWKVHHLMNKVRVPWIIDGLIESNVIYSSRKLASDALSGLRILDVGCGAGILTEALAHLHADVVGIDASESLIDLAKRNSDRFNFFTRKRLTYVCETIEDHAYNYPEHYDVVVLSEVLEHVADKDTFLKNCVAALKPGGSIFVTSFNKTAWSYMTKVFGEQVFRVVPSGTHTWSMLVRPKTVWQTLEKYGCEKACVCGFEYDMLKSEWRLCRNTWNNYALHMMKRPAPVVYYHTIEY